MSRRCEISGKSFQSGNNVSHANNKTRRTWLTNLRKKRLFDSETKSWVRLKVSSRMLRTIAKKGLGAALRDAGLSIDQVRIHD